MNAWTSIRLRLGSALLVFTGTICAVSGCDDDPLPLIHAHIADADAGDDGRVAPAPELRRFTLETRDNPGLTATIEGKVGASEIDVVIPVETNARALIARFEVAGGDVFVGDARQTSGVTPNSFDDPLTYRVRGEGGERSYAVRVTFDETSDQLPHVHIDTEGGAPIVDKKTWVDGTIRIEGGPEYDGLGERPVQIRGRGNSTWVQPKKPYRIKLKDAASVLGLPAEKNWILLANYLDDSLMGNALAMKAGQLLDLPFTHHMIPVNVTLNGEYVGNYVLTEHKEVKKDRINIGKDGVLLELDTYFDDDYKFTSAAYELPVMVQFPKLEDVSAEEADEALDAIKTDFEALEALIADASFPNNAYRASFDAQAFAKYMAVIYFSVNKEVNFPKSVYMYKKKNEPYRMGPLWDFDLAWGRKFATPGTQFSDPTQDLFWTAETNGTPFFQRLFEDPVVRQAFKDEWQAFRADKYAEFIAYTEAYAEKIRGSYARDHRRWRQGPVTLTPELPRILGWLNDRAAFVDAMVADM